MDRATFSPAKNIIIPYFRVAIIIPSLSPHYEIAYNIAILILMLVVVDKTGRQTKQPQKQ